MKTDFFRAPESDIRSVDANLKVQNALFIPVFEGDPTLNDNPDQSGAIGAKNGQLWLYFDGVWLPVGGSGASFPDATELVKGKIKLAGDIGGTADLPTVPALAGKEDKSQKNVANGYAGLDGSGVIPTAILPGYVDDIIEVDDFASLPVTGESGKAYFTKDNNKTYRWGGTVYVEIVGSPGSTDAVPEGSVNLYFTNARAIASTLTGYVKAAAATAITAATSILEAISILEKKVDDASDLDMGEL